MEKNRVKAVIFILLSVSAVCAAPDVMQSESPIQEQTALVYRRYYFVARLDKTIKLLAKMYHDVNAMQSIFAPKTIVFDEIVPQETYLLFTHKQIRHSVKEIEHTRSLKPLFMVWDSFKAYKSLHDDLLVEDFSKEIFIITRNTLDSLYKHDKIHYRDVRFDRLTFDQRLDVISDMTHRLGCALNGESDITPNRVNDMADVHLAVHTDQVAFRFYCVHRLHEALDYILSQSHFDKIVWQADASLQAASFPEPFIGRKSSVRQKIEQAWADVMQYKHIDNDRFMHKFVVYVYVLLHHQFHKKQIKRPLMYDDDIVAVHQRIEQLSIEEILQSIDHIVKQVHNVSAHYHKSGLTLDQWIKQYWWAPTAVCTMIAIKCFILYYRNFRTL